MFLIASGSTASLCISSMRRARLSARSNKAERGASSGEAVSSASISWASSRCLRMRDTGWGMARVSGVSSRPERSLILGKRRAGPEASNSVTRCSERRVLNINVVFAHDMGSCPCSRCSSPRAIVFGKSQPRGR